MFSAEMPDFPPYVTCGSGLWKQTDGSDSKNTVTLGGNQSTGTHEKGREALRDSSPPPPPPPPTPVPAPPSSSYQRIHWENWMWFVCVFLKRGAHKQPWKGPLYSARQQRCASLGRPFVFAPCSQNLKRRGKKKKKKKKKKRGLILSGCEQAQMMPLDLGARFGWKKKKASGAFEVI